MAWQSVGDVIAMGNRTKNAIGCLVIALIFLGVAINNSFFTADKGFNDPSGFGLSYIVGSFFPFVILLAVSLWLFFTPEKKA